MNVVFSLRYLKVFVGVILTAVAALLAGCSGQGSNDVLKVGVMAGPEADVMKVAVAKLKADTGIEAKLVEFFRLCVSQYCAI